MTLNDFILKYDGKNAEVAGSAGALNQCVDLANAYIQDVLGVTPIVNANAEDFPSKVSKEYTFTKYAPGLIPERGDIVIWNSTVGPYGHIAVFLSGDDRSFISFDQNWPIKSVCHMQPHPTYKGVAGWLRFNNLSQIDMEELKQLRKDHENFVTETRRRLDQIEKILKFVLQSIQELPTVSNTEKIAKQKVKRFRLGGFKELKDKVKNIIQTI